MTQQRATTIWGPVADTSPLWRATLGTAYSGEGHRPVIQKTLALRTLVQDAVPSPINASGATYAFHRPRLLQAAVEARGGGWNELRLGDNTTNAETVYLLDLGNQSAVFNDILLAPRDEHWADKKTEIETPPFRLIAGRIRVWIPLAKRADNSPAKDEPWLGYAKIGAEHRLFTDIKGADPINGLHVLARSKGGAVYLPAELTSDGIAFFARVPDPLKGFNEAADKVWARVRLFETAASTKRRRLYGLAFEGACAVPATPIDWSHPAPAPLGDHADAIEAGFASVFNDARTLGVRIDFDRRPAVPPFSFALETRTGGSRPTFPATGAGWICLFDEALFRVNILSVIDGVPANATLKCENASLAVTRTAAEIVLSSDDGSSGERKVTLTRDHVVGHWQLGQLQAKSLAAARLPLAAVEKRLTALYTASDLIDSAVDTTVPAFMPIEHGWLQIPLRDADVAAAQAIDRSVIDGTAAFPLDDGRLRTIEISGASASKLTLSIKRGLQPSCERLSLVLDDTAGRLRGLVHIADCSPAGGEILPRLRAGATREWPVQFGQGDPNGAIGVADPDPVLGTFSLVLAPDDPSKPETRVLSWQRDGAWISTRNFAQTRGSGLPVAARSLVPRLVKTPCRLIRSTGRVLPSLLEADLGDVWDAFAAPAETKAEYETTQLQPALPGIERHGITANYTYSLRLDLPPLDDLFAAMQIEDAPLLRLGEKSWPDPGRTAALATAAAPGRLREAWRIICDNHRLTRTRYNCAFERGTAKVTLANLALPFERKNVHFSFDLDNGKNLPLGRYFLDGASFAGADALAGLSGNFDVTKSGQPVLIELQGNAAARWSPQGSSLRYDFAGTGIDAAPALSRSVEILTEADSGETVKLTTLFKPVPLEDDLMFWFRDIPFQNGAFDGPTGADGFVCNVDTRSPSRFARSLYEWRVWSKQDCTCAGDIALSYGFVARPLRLYRIVGDANRVTRLELVASLIAPLALDAGRDSEAGETGPAQNLVQVIYDYVGSFTFKRTVVRVKVVDDAVKPFTAADIAAERDRARFEVRPAVDLTSQANDAVILTGRTVVRRDGTLTCTISPDGTIGQTKLTLTLFGHAVTFERQVGSSYGGGEAAIEFAPPVVGLGKIELRSACLSWKTGLSDKPAAFTAAPFLDLPFAGHGGALTLEIDFATGRIGWLGAKFPITAKIDHDQAAITIKGAELEGAPIIGLTFNKGGALALFAVLDTLAVSGFAHVSASFAPADRPATLVLGHGFRSAAGTWSDELTLDLTGSGASSMQWPQDVVAMPGKRPEDEIAAVSTVRIKGGNALRHTVDFSIRGAAVPTTSLDAAGRLARPWHISMRADHRLRAPDQRVLRWTSLDEVTIADLKSIADQARAGLTVSPVYGFGGRYSGNYRGRVSDQLPDMLRPGLYERGLVAAGFPDTLIAEALAGAQPHGLALFGAGVSLFGVTGGQSVPLALPWLIGLEKADLGPLTVLAQAPAPGTVKTWSSAWYDARGARLLASPPGVPLALGDPSATLLARQIEPPSETRPARALLAAVEQPFFEDPAGKIAIDEAPVFLRSVVMLASAWSELSALGDAQSRLTQPLLRRDGTCALFAPSPGVQRFQRAWSLRLVCIDDTKTEFRRPRSDLDLPDVGAATSALLATLHGALGDRPLLFTVMALSAFEEDGERLALWRNIEISHRTIMASAWAELEAPALREVSDRLFVASTLGWPEAPSLRHGPETLAMGENRPFQDRETAIAGRRAAFASTAGGGPTQRPWITFRLQPLFSAMALPSVMAATPRQLDIAPRRPRLPAADRQPNIVPSRFAAISLGYRPGTVHLAMTALKEAGTKIPDPHGHQAIAHRSHYHPVLAGQDRMPRTTVLPKSIESLDWRRETFVLPRSAKCRIERVPAIAFRTYAPIPEPGDVPPPRELVVLKVREMTINLTGGAALTLINDGAVWPAWHPYTSRQFRLRVGSRSWPFTALDAAGQITLMLETGAAAEADALALKATGDTVIACELILSASTEDADPKAPLAAPNLTLQLPLTIARATEIEPVLAVPGATLVFGDPAYDRMLASMTASDTKRIDTQLAILTTDRQTYDLVSPVLVSLGLKGADGTITRLATYRLTIKRFREGMKDPTQCVFDIPQTMNVASLSIDLMVQEGLGSVQPGDRLTLSATFGIAIVHYSLSLQIVITREPAVPPAPAVYHLLTMHGVSQTKLDAATALSASGPTCEIVEYPALETDLMAGYVRRRGLFVWRFAPDERPYFDRFGYLVKIDRSGAGQLPAELADFEAAIALPSFDSKARRLPGPDLVTAFAPSPAKTIGGTVANAGKRVKSGKAGRKAKLGGLQDAPKPRK